MTTSTSRQAGARRGRPARWGSRHDTPGCHRRRRPPVGSVERETALAASGRGQIEYRRLARWRRSRAAISSTSTQSTPSRCMPSGVGLPGSPGLASTGTGATRRATARPAAADSGVQRSNIPQTSLQNGTQRRMVRDLLAHRLEPALQPAIQRIIVAALVVRLVRLAPYSRLARRKHRVPAPAPVPAAIGHVGVHAEVVPTRPRNLPSQTSPRQPKPRASPPPMREQNPRTLALARCPTDISNERLARAFPKRPNPRMIKSFLLLFFKKEGLTSSLPTKRYCPKPPAAATPATWSGDAVGRQRTSTRTGLAGSCAIWL